jgi:hypothetical protein
MADCFLIPPERREGIPNISGWIPKAHFHSELVEFVREGIRNCEPTAKLSIRMMGLQTLSQQTEERLSQDEIILEEYYEVFNEIFFSTALQHNRSTFNMIRAGTDEWKARKNELRAYTTYKRPSVSSREEAQASIHIFEIVESGNETRAQGMQSYIGTLLHEMIHAFIQVYTCRCAHCVKKHTEYEREGQTGHGRTWQVIAHAVEKFCCNELGLELDLSRAYALAEEIHATRVEMPYGDCLDWELDDERVGDLCEFYGLREQRTFPPLGSSNDEKDNNNDDDQEESDG